MKNEYGVPMDANGYAPSIMETAQGICYLCGCGGDTARHEVFGGPYRKKSKALGLWVYLCPCCHQYGPQAVHRSADTANQLKKEAQHAAMQHYGWSFSRFIEAFGKSYL